MFFGKGVLKICSKFTIEHPCRSCKATLLKTHFSIDLQILQKNSIDLNYICWVAVKKVTKLDTKDIFIHFPEYCLIKIIKNVFRILLTIYYEFSSNQKQKKRRKKLHQRSLKGSSICLMYFYDLLLHNFLLYDTLW